MLIKKWQIECEHRVFHKTASSPISCIGSQPVCRQKLHCFRIMVYINECAVRQTDCIHFLQIDGQNDTLLFIFNVCQRECQLTIGVEAWYEEEPLTLELVLFPHN